MKAKRHCYTDEQMKFVSENIKGTPYKEMWERFNRKFDTNLKYSQFQGFLTRNNFKNGNKGEFSKGHRPWNEGMKGLNLAGENGRKTQFKKGHIPSNYRHVGSERIDNKDGYVRVKVSNEGGFQDKWKLKHRIVWEKVNGEIPDNHVVIFADCDRYNFDLDNLVLIHREQLLKLNRKGYINGDPELLKVGLNLISLDKEIYNFEIKGGDPEEFERSAKIAERNGIDKETFRARRKRGWTMKDAAYKPLHTKLKPSRGVARS